VRLEVALAGNRVLYAWPGSRHFEERPLQDLVRTGSIRTGEFGLLAQTIFLSGAAEFPYAGPEYLHGSQERRFLYSAARERSKCQSASRRTRSSVSAGHVAIDYAWM
jgi:hypothetical protein